LRILLVLGAAALLAGCGDGNVYGMPVADVYARLADYRPAPANRGPFGRLVSNVTGDDDGRTVTWTATGSHARRRCVATLVPLDEARTRIDLTCGGGGAGEGAAAGLAVDYSRRRVIEMIDARLTGRDYDPERAQGATAASWPADAVDHGNLATAQRDALSMERDLRQAQQE